ncbi:MAG: tRNA (adenosine(37)-N6)-dimethylallyltransferase MiaA [Flavobacteriaceae bacterium]|nr:tRNA (adenosine(37)-N6)-dimethylallyltransferase MiaA [Flavobacteriaceae bacterium]
MINYLITIVGPTAIGKTSLAISVARHFNTEIISCDSRQFYKEMKIGTAVPTKKELLQVKHHFIQHIPVKQDYNVGQFEKDAIQKLDELFLKHSVVVMVGGSGLYVDAVLKGLDEFPKVSPDIRKKLKIQLEEIGIRPLQEQLKQLDLISYNSIDLENHQRLIRALEISIGTGKPFSSYLTQSHAKRNFNAIKIGLTAERPLIYDRINRRVDLMMKNGLLNEVKSLYKYKHLNALQTVGYKELFSYIDNETTLDFAIEEIKKNTRRFAKRQLTWFRKDTEINWFDFQTDHDKIINYIDAEIV